MNVTVIDTFWLCFPLAETTRSSRYCWHWGVRLPTVVSVRLMFDLWCELTSGSALLVFPDDAGCQVIFAFCGCAVDFADVLSEFRFQFLSLPPLWLVPSLDTSISCLLRFVPIFEWNRPPLNACPYLGASFHPQCIAVPTWAVAPPAPLLIIRPTACHARSHSDRSTGHV